MGEEFNGHEPLVGISARVALHVWKRKQEEHWTWTELIMLGLKAKDNNPQLLVRVTELEEINKKLSAKVQQLAMKQYELENKQERNIDRLLDAVQPSGDA